jgi:hypothetical protein
MYVQYFYVILWHFHSIVIYVAPPWTFALQGSRETWPLVRIWRLILYCYKGSFLRYISCIVLQLKCQLSIFRNSFKTFITCYLSQVDNTVSKTQYFKLVREIWCFNKAYEVKSKSHCDCRSVSQPSWCWAPFGTNDQMLSLGSDRYRVSRHVASSLTRERVCQLLFVVIFVKSVHIYISHSTKIHTQYIKSTINNIYMASVSPGHVQQIMP